MFKRTKVCSGLMLAFGGTLALGAAPAFAQQQLERVEITGTNIRRVQSETASAVQTVTREEIDRSGKASVAELLQTLAIDNQGSVPTTFGNGFASGASGISLRGLGAASTLVLINGRRIAPYGLADDGQKVFADLNVIPLEAVERVEILKDGASAIYGSDAIAGVVNIILRRDFKGTVAKASYGASGYGDGKEKRASVTHGFGNLDTDRYNVMLNLELGRKGEIWNRDRADRNQVGRTDLRDLGFDAQTTTFGGLAAGGTGAILANNLAGSSRVGNVRNPATNDYFSRGTFDLDPVTGLPIVRPATGFARVFPGAKCENFTAHRQGDPLGGCLTDTTQEYSQIQPSQESTNFFARGTLQVSTDMQGYAEVNYYQNKSESPTTPSGISGSVGFPGGPVSNSGVALGATHPDNPYNAVARLRYYASDVGPRVSNIDSKFTRLVAGVKGTFQAWDYDSAALYSENKVANSRTGYLQKDVTFALLNPANAVNVASANLHSAAFAALPVGSFWRIAESAGLNSPAIYAALSPTIANDAVSKTAQVDFKVSRELGQLDGGPIGVALGTEFRKEHIKLDPTSGTERGNIIGLGYSAYSGTRNVYALYGEVLAPVLKTVELSAAVRADHYSDVGNSTTPKVGAKWTPAKEFALRGTYAQGFRAPSSAENGVGGLAAFSTAADPLRCNLGVASACSANVVAIITSPNPALTPEKSKSFTLGLIWDPAPKTSISLDLWEIRRSNEINQEQTDAAIAKGQVARDPTTATAIPGDPGQITAVLANYVNSAETKVRGLDLDFRQGFDLGQGNGKLTFDAKWTHIFTWLRTEQDGTSRDFAGSHGNCDVTNCIGTPADRMNFGATWELGGLKLSGVVNYRGSMQNKLFKNDPAGCVTTFANGNDAPIYCRIDSFKTLDLSMRYSATERLEVFGSIQNLFDAIPPLDPTTYGAAGYNPLDYSGAVGRFFTLGLKYKFF